MVKRWALHSSSHPNGLLVHRGRISQLLRGIWDSCESKYRLVSMSLGQHRSVCFSRWHWGVSVPGKRTVFIVRSNLSLFPRGNYFKWLWQQIILPIFQSTKSLPPMPFPQATPVSIPLMVLEPGHSLSQRVYHSSFPDLGFSCSLSWSWSLIFCHCPCLTNKQVEAFSNMTTNSLNNDCTSNK